MKKLIFLFFIFILGCVSIEPLEIELVGDDSVYIHDSLSFECDITGGKEPYSYSWNTDCKNSSNCVVNFKELGSEEIKCLVIDSKNNNISSSIVVNVEKIPKKIDYMVGIGDSLTKGHGVDSWLSYYSDDFDVLNYAVNGATSYSAAEYQLLEFEKSDVKGEGIIFLWFGFNDIKSLISVEEFRVNYRKVVEEVIDYNATVFLFTIPDASNLEVAYDVEEGVNKFLADVGLDIKVPVRTIGKDVIDTYNNEVRNIALEFDLPIIDTFSYIKDFDDSLIGEDRVHPTAKGQEEIYLKVKSDFSGYFSDYRLY